MEVLDWLIVAFSLGGTLVIGYGVRKYVGRLSDYLVAGRGLGVYAGTASLVSTEIGIITYLYYAELGFVTGFSCFIAGLIVALVAFAVGRTGFVVARLRALQLMTIPQYFEVRYSRGVRVLAGVLMATGGALNLGIFPRLEASFLNIVMGIPEEYLVATMALLLIIGLIYTALGGMVSVIVTNYIQYLLLALGTVTVTFVMLGAVGWSGITSAVEEQLGRDGFNPLTHPDLGPVFILWQLLIWTALMTVWQSVAMRAFAARDTRTVKKIFTLTSGLFLGRAIIPMFWGAAALAFFGVASKADPLSAMPRMLSSLLPSGLLGLMLAGMLAASLSTYSGYLLGWSSIISQDILKPLIRRPLGEKGSLRLSRGCVVGLAVFILFWGLIYELPGSAYFYLQVTGNLFLAGTFVAIAAGLYWDRASVLGAYLALILSAAGSLGFFFLNLSASAAGFGAWGLSVLGMLLGSLLRPSWQPSPVAEPAQRSSAP